MWLCYSEAMNRATLEKLTASLVVSLISVFAVGLILVIANAMFEWDIFPPFTEKILYFLGAASFVIILSAAFVNVMLNISRLAFFSQKIAEKLVKDTADQN